MTAPARIEERSKELRFFEYADGRFRVRNQLWKPTRPDLGYKLEPWIFDHSTPKVYFIKAGLHRDFVEEDDDGEETPAWAVKIGFATNPFRRLVEVRANNPNFARIIGLMMGGAEKERTAHAVFRDDHLCGEWFQYSEEMQEFIYEHTVFDGEDWEIVS